MDVRVLQQVSDEPLGLEPKTLQHNVGFGNGQPRANHVEPETSTLRQHGPGSNLQVTRVILKVLYGSVANKALVERFAQLEDMAAANKSFLERFSLLENSIRKQSARQVVSAISSIAGLLQERCVKFEESLGLAVS